MPSKPPFLITRRARVRAAGTFRPPARQGAARRIGGAPAGLEAVAGLEPAMPERGQRGADAVLLVEVAVGEHDSGPVGGDAEPDATRIRDERGAVAGRFGGMQAHL